MFVEGDSEFPCYSIDEARKKWETARGDTLPVICGESNLNWTVGLFYRDDERRQFEDVLTFPDDIGLEPMGVRALDFNFKQEIEQKAVFGELDYQIGDINLLVGGRYYKEDKKSFTVTKGWLTFAAPEANSGEDDASVFIPKAVVKYTPTDTFTTYLSYSEGFRAGGVNALADSAGAIGVFIPSGFDPENLASWEIAFKKTWLDRRLRTDVYFYRNSWDDMIQSFFEPETGFSYEGNAGKSESQGVEFEVTAAATERLDVSFGITYIDTEFKEDVFEPETGRQLVVAGNRIPRIPEWSYNLALDYRIPLGQFDGLLRADYSYRGDTFSEVQNSAISKTDNLNILNLRAGVMGERWGVFLFASNVTNEDGSVVAITPGTPSASFVDATFVAPRELGIEARYEF